MAKGGTKQIYGCILFHRLIIFGDRKLSEKIKLTDEIIVLIDEIHVFRRLFVS